MIATGELYSHRVRLPKDPASDDRSFWRARVGEPETEHELPRTRGSVLSTRLLTAIMNGYGTPRLGFGGMTNRLME